MYSPCYAICSRYAFHARLLDVNHFPECRFVLVDRCKNCGQPIHEPHKGTCTACGHRLRWLKDRPPSTVPEVQPSAAKPWIGWESAGLLDIIPQVDEAHDWAVSQPLEWGIVIPPRGGPQREDPFCGRDSTAVTVRPFYSPTSNWHNKCCVPTHG